MLVGIAGAPGAGKSTIAEALVAELGARAALVPMDGFHYSQHVLELLGRAERKGAADTFDADGLAALLHRIRTATGDVYAPTFDRSIEEPIAAGTVVEFSGISGSQLAVAAAPAATSATPYAGVASTTGSAGATLEIVQQGVATVTASGPIAVGDTLTWNGAEAVTGSDSFGTALEPLTGTGSVRVWVWGGKR